MIPSSSAWCRSSSITWDVSELATLPLVDVLEQLVVFVGVVFAHGGFPGAEFGRCWAKKGQQD
jgi:hypothetical protein